MGAEHLPERKPGPTYLQLRNGRPEHELTQNQRELLEAIGLTPPRVLEPDELARVRLRRDRLIALQDALNAHRRLGEAPPRSRLWLWLGTAFAAAVGVASFTTWSDLLLYSLLGAEVVCVGLYAVLSFRWQRQLSDAFALVRQRTAELREVGDEPRA